MTVRTIHLHGEMADIFGGSFRLDVDTLPMAFRALGAQLRGFRAYVAARSFRLVRGASIAAGREIGEDEIGMRLSGDLHVVPVIAGSGGGREAGVGKLVAGVAIAAVAWWAAPAAAAGGMGATVFGGVTYGNIAGFGLMVALAGASSLLTTQPKKRARDQSTLFGQSVNVAEEGATIPWVWGEAIIGSVVASGGISAEDVAIG